MDFISDEVFDRYTQFITEYTESCDEGHNMTHVMEVAYLAREFARDDGLTEAELQRVYIAGMAHELKDSKQERRYSQAELRQKLEEIGFLPEDIDLLDFISGTVSFSKVTKMLAECGMEWDPIWKPTEFQIIVKGYVGDADMLECVGRRTDGLDNSTCVNRMVAFAGGKKSFQELGDHMIDHYNVKFWVLPKLIKTEKVRILFMVYLAKAKKDIIKWRKEHGCVDSGVKFIDEE